jgi:chromosome segregation ATPase
MADLRVERDQYWSRFNSSQDSNRTLATMAREERDRANEAARLSAEARDLRTEIAEMEEVIQDLRQDLQRHSDARIVETRARCRAEQVQFTHSMFAYPHLFLWHALFDGTPLCRCWHSREMREHARALDVE